MKKLLLVLLVVTLASFLFVGCIPVTPSEGEGEGEGEGEAEICPTVAVTSQVAVGGKNYIKGGAQTITVTFAVPTEPVSVFVGGGLRVALDPVEVVMYADATKTVYTGTFTFGTQSECGEAYIYVETCETCDYCKYPYTVDTVAPLAQVEICIAECDCAGCELSFTSTTSSVDCADDTDNCGDDCSGFASWSIDVYDADPFDECCEVPCEVPIASDSGVCPIDFTTACLGTSPTETLYVVVTLVDEVGNATKMEAKIEFNPDTCDEIILTPIAADDCVDTPDFVLCEGIGYTLTMAVDPIGGGTATDQTGSSPYAENTLINIFADPASGYEFLYWTTLGGAYDANFVDANDPSTTFTMPGANTTVTARFLEFVQNNKTFSESCDTWTADQSAGGVGITIDIWDISSISTGNAIDFRFDAMGIPDRWFIYYNGALAYETGWRGNSIYDGNPLYPGGVTSPPNGEQLAVVTKLSGVDTLEIRTEGADSGTASDYNLREECPN